MDDLVAPTARSGIADLHSQVQKIMLHVERRKRRLSLRHVAERGIIRPNGIGETQPHRLPVLLIEGPKEPAQ